MKMSKHNPKNVLLVGATGYLGGFIGEALLDLGAHLRILVRPGSRAKLSPTLAGHSEIVEDVSEAFAGIYSVVSAVQGGAETIVGLQLDLLRRARKAGVRRFIPSDFSFNFFALDDDENINSDLRHNFARQAAERRGELEVVHLMSGCFLDESGLYGFLGAFDKTCREAYLWGDGEEKMQFTTCADTAAYTARIALDDRPVAERVFVAGDSLNFHELVTATADGLGHEIAVRRMGSLADLGEQIKRRQQAEPNNPLAWLPLNYWHGMLSGRGRLGALSNSRYPDIRSTDVRTYTAAMRHRPAWIMRVQNVKGSER
jgi:nucleoside-diphosphate-sugar epimerase